MFRPHLLRSSSLIQACCSAFQISGTLLLNTKPLTSRANLKMKKSIMNSTSFHQSEWWSLCLETSKIIPLPNFLLTNKKIQQNDAALLKMGQQKPACPKKKWKSSCHTIRVQLFLSGSFEYKTSPGNRVNSSGVSNMFLTRTKNPRWSKSLVYPFKWFTRIFFCGWKSVKISKIHPSPKLIRAPKSCWVYL